MSEHFIGFRVKTFKGSWTSHVLAVPHANQIIELLHILPLVGHELLHGASPQKDTELEKDDLTRTAGALPDSQAEGMVGKFSFIDSWNHTIIVVGKDL